MAEYHNLLVLGNKLLGQTLREPLLLSEVETTAQPELFYADHPRLPFHRCTTNRSFYNQNRWVKLDADLPPSGSSVQAFPHYVTIEKF